MIKCPICETEIDEKHDYCSNCAWEFEYYFDELSDEERERYETRLSIWKSKFHNNEIKSVKDNSIIGSIVWSIFFVILIIVFLELLKQYCLNCGTSLIIIMGIISSFLTFIIVSFLRKKIKIIKDEKNIYLIGIFIFLITMLIELGLFITFDSLTRRFLTGNVIFISILFLTYLKQKNITEFEMFIYKIIFYFSLIEVFLFFQATFFMTYDERIYLNIVTIIVLIVLFNIFFKNYKKRKI